MSAPESPEPESAPNMTADEIDRFYCTGCDGDTRNADHFGCTYCGNCTCEGGC